MAISNAERRLHRILSDEDYGPKLARLRGEDERYILRLIDQNKGKDARREIVRLDEERRARERVKRQAKRGPPAQAQRTLSRREREQRAARNIVRRLGGRANPKRVASNVGFMTDDELDFAATADLGSLVDQATRPAYVTIPSGKVFNPFWYH